MITVSPRTWFTMDVLIIALNLWAVAHGHSVWSVIVAAGITAFAVRDFHEWRDQREEEM